MEDGLVLDKLLALNCKIVVLIRVVVEDGLVPAVFNLKNLARSLNPCCSGRWSRTPRNDCRKFCHNRLNPCCSGRWSRTDSLLTDKHTEKEVLILVVVEDGLVLMPENVNTPFDFES